MRCPNCEQRIHRTATGCPHCGYSLADADVEFGGFGVELKMGSLGDGAGLMRRAERKRAEAAMKRFRARFPQLFFAVCTVSLEDSVNLRRFGFWLLNRAEFGGLGEGVGNDAGVLLVIDAESRAASLTYGYRVEPFLNEMDTFKCLSKAHPYFLEGDWLHGIVAVAKSVDKVLRRRWWRGLLRGGRFATGRRTSRRAEALTRQISFGTESNEVKA